MLKSYSSDYETKRVVVIKSLIPEGPYQSLDIACGIGVFSKIMREKGHTVTGVDINQENIEFAKEKYKDLKGLNFLSYDIDDMMQQNEGIKYDFILALEIVEHLVDYQKFIRDCYSLLKENGTMIISTPNRYSLEGLFGTRWAIRAGNKFLAWDAAHRRVFNSFEFVNLLKRQNFLITKIVGFYFNTRAKIPLTSFKIGLPFDSVRHLPLNMFGFNVIIVAKRKI